MLIETIISTVITSALNLGMIVYIWVTTTNRITKLEGKADKQPEICKYHDQSCDVKMTSKIEDRLKLVQRDLDYQNIRIEHLERQNKELQEIKTQVALILQKITIIEKIVDKK